MTTPSHAPTLTQTASSVPSLTDSQAVDLLRVGQIALEAAASAERRDVALGAVVRLVHQLTNAVVVAYFRRSREGELTFGPRVVPNWPKDQLQALLPVLQKSAQTAAERGMAQIKILDADHNLVAVSVPVSVDARHHEALTTVLLLDSVTGSNSQSIEPFLVIFQLVAAMIGLWHVQPRFATARVEARRTGHLTAMLDALLSKGDLTRGVEALAAELKSRFGYQMAAVGLCHAKRKTCRLQAISGLPQFDRRSEVVRCMETVFDEAVLRGSTEGISGFGDLGISGATDGKIPESANPQIPKSPNPQIPKSQTTAQNRLCALTSAKAIVTGPLQNQQGKPVGAWIFLGKEPSPEQPELIDSIRAAAPHVGNCLNLLRRAESGRVTASVRRLIGRWHGLRGMVKILAVAAVVAVMMLPMPYKISCNCLLQPVTRRYVAAPYEAKLEEALVEPGDLVAGGDVLARMNGLEIRWKLDDAIAEYNRAQKMRSSSLAGGDVAAAQISAFEMERLDLKIRMLESRAEHLEIKAPISGLVISGDLKRTEGTPLAQGDVLFEIAPLGEMVVELAVPADEISHVRVGQHVEIRLDAHPKLALSGKLAKIHPRAEQREAENVFVSEVILDDPDRVLRPGMAGRAKIVGRKHALGWNLFHKAYEYLAYRVGW